MGAWTPALILVSRTELVSEHLYLQLSGLQGLTRQWNWMPELSRRCAEKENRGDPDCLQQQTPDLSSSSAGWMFL